MLVASQAVGSIAGAAGGVLGSDLQQAVDLATLMFTNLGLEALQFHDVTTAVELDDLRRSDPALRRRVERLLEEQLERAETIIRERDHEIRALVAALMDREAVSGREVKTLFRSSADGRPAA